MTTRKFLIWVLVSLIALAIVIMSAYFVYKHNSFNYFKWGTLGDAIAGLIGTLIGAITVVVLLITFNQEKGKERRDFILKQLLEINVKYESFLLKIRVIRSSSRFFDRLDLVKRLHFTNVLFIIQELSFTLGLIDMERNNTLLRRKFEFVYHNLYKEVLADLVAYLEVRKTEPINQDFLPLIDKVLSEINRLNIAVANLGRRRN